MKKYKIGYNSGGNYLTKINGIETREYSIWRSILRRCFSIEYQTKFPTYIGCTIDERWMDFQVFAKWYHENYVHNWLIDKDIIIKGNKIYGPDTCCFVPLEISNLLVKRDSKRGDNPIGVSFNKHKYENDVNKFTAQISICGQTKHLGYYPSKEAAFEVAKLHKENHIKDIANKWKAEISEKVYQALINYRIEITD